MMSDIARTMVHTLTRPASKAVPAIGLIGGCTLGVVARGWMRLISEHPEFTWSGTIFIVIGFSVFGLAQSTVLVARRRCRRRWTAALVRMFGVVTMLPLFVAAGAVMFPTVIGGGLAVARTRWHTSVRRVLLVVATGPVVVAGRQIVGSFGWSFRTLNGFVLMLAIYSAIIWATKCTFSACVGDPRPSLVASEPDPAGRQPRGAGPAGRSTD
ncbi:MAG: hypothetical protein ABIO83_02475 [Ilumatobacteraceae bacterium]